MPIRTRLRSLLVTISELRPNILAQLAVVAVLVTAGCQHAYAESDDGGATIESDDQVTVDSGDGEAVIESDDQVTVDSGDGEAVIESDGQVTVKPNG